MMKIKHRLFLAIMIIAVCILTAGCSQSGTAAPEAPQEEAAATPAPTPAEYVILGKSYAADTESIDLTGITDKQVKMVVSPLSSLKSLKTLTLGSQEDTPLTWKNIRRLHEACTQAVIDYAFTLYDRPFNLSDGEMDLKYIKIQDEGYLVGQIASCMTNLRYLDMDSCGVSNEKMAELRDSLPDTEVVWRIWFGDYYSVRTNVEKILASMPGKAGELIHDNAMPLQYCTKLKYLDLGHNNYLDTIEFVSSMPDLEVLIVGMSFVEDFSPLENCPKLEYLEAMTSRLHDLTPLSGLKNLQHLNICYNFSVRDISPLYGLTNLKRLWIGKYDPVPPEQIAKIRELLPNCVVNDTTEGPTEEGWRMSEVPDGSGYPRYDERYALLREQFGYEEWDYAYYWNDPLYYYGG